MYLKADKDGFSVLLNLLEPLMLETTAIQAFRKNSPNDAGIFYSLSEIGLKIAKGILSQKKKIKITNAEASFIVAWFATIEDKQEDLFALNTLRKIKNELHQQLTNYQSKY